MLKSPTLLAVLVIASGAWIASAHAQQAQEKAPQKPDFVRAFSGDWVTFEPSVQGDGHCSVELDAKESGKNYSASEASCSGALADVAAWGIVDQQLAILGSDRSVLARLGGNQNRISGKLKDGAEIVFERQPHAGEIHKQWSSIDCLYYGYSSKCADKAAEAAAAPVTSGTDRPQKLSVLIKLNMRAEPRPDANVVSVVAAKACVPVKQCTTASDGLWCEISSDGKSGWVAKQSVRLGKFPIITYINGCGGQTK